MPCFLLEYASVWLLRMPDALPNETEGEVGAFRCIQRNSHVDGGGVVAVCAAGRADVPQQHARAREAEQGGADGL